MAELVVVGGGPAGLATAIAARVRGFGATVLDKRAPPIDKACGEGLLPAGRAALARLGVELAREEGCALDGLRFQDAAVDEFRALEIPFELPGLGVARPTLHRALARRAEALGVRLRWQTPALGLVEGGVAIAEGTLRASCVVGADGLHSKVARWAGFDVRAAEGSAAIAGVRQRFACAPWSERVEIHVAEGAEAYVTPLGPAELGVALLGVPARFDELISLRSFPTLRARLSGTERVGSVLGAGPFPRRVRRLVRGSIVLVGDAAGALDPVAGLGVSLALLQAERLAAALEHGDLGVYERETRHQLARAARSTRVLTLSRRAPGVRRRVIAWLRRHPALARAWLAWHVGEAQTPAECAAARIAS